MGPFTWKKESGGGRAEPYLPHQLDEFTVKKISSFWKKSFIDLPLAGVCFTILGAVIVRFDGVLAEFLQSMTLEVSTPTFLGKTGIAIALFGVVMLVRGIYNIITR